jgi:hypothetical protein
MTPTATLKGVEVFQAGKYPVKEPDGSVVWAEYTPRDLEDMVRNFKLAPNIDVPLVIGHEESQSLDAEFADPWPAAFAEGGLPDMGWDAMMSNTGVPSFGRMANPRVAVKQTPDGPKKVIRADFLGVHHAIAALVNRGNYSRVSAEVHDRPTHGYPANCKGKTFRRVALLGGVPPNQTGLAPLPAARFADLTPGRLMCVLKPAGGVRSPGGLRVFSEVTMDRAALEAQLKALGWSDTLLKALEPLADEDFAVATNAALAQAAGVDTATPPEETPPPETPPGDAAPTRDEMAADLVALGVTQEEIDAMSDEELAAKWQEMKGTPMADPVKPPTVDAKKFAQLQAGFRTLELQQRREIAARNARVTAESKLAAEAVLKRWREENRLLPYQYDADPKRKAPNLRDRLMRADHVKVRKFAEGAPSMTEFESVVAEVEAAQPPDFARMHGPRIPEQDEGQFADVDRDLDRYMARRGMGKRK